jgi:hypothetical protein
MTRTRRVVTHTFEDGSAPFAALATQTSLAIFFQLKESVSSPRE